MEPAFEQLGVARDFAVNLGTALFGLREGNGSVQLKQLLLSGAAALLLLVQRRDATLDRVETEPLAPDAAASGAPPRAAALAAAAAAAIVILAVAARPVLAESHLEEPRQRDGIHHTANKEAVSSIVKKLERKKEARTHNEQGGGRVGIC